MKLKSWRRLISQDYDEKDQKLIEQISSPINNGMNELYFTLNGRTSLTDNIHCTIKDLDITVNQNGSPKNGASFNLDKPGNVIGVTVLAAFNQQNTNSYPTSQPFVSFVQNGSSIIINNITGLPENQRFMIRLVAWLG